MFTATPLRRLVGATALLAAVASGGAALADDDDVMQLMPFGAGPYGGGMGNMSMMARPIDIDGDGTVTSSEASQHASAGFSLFDSDGDDQITEDEYIDGGPFMAPVGRRSTERLYVNRVARFKAMDGDSDDIVTLAEFMAKAQASFEAADADNDGTVTVWEFRAQQNPF
ncbi:hypothetical protein [Yoonia sp.]|uniref:hypothetical protein n=1 Tax=Yoonia sp. TaxID=2212373 RepID=UPI0025F0A953|nr:hypothetical protein [Yoonia sp.]